MSRLTQKELQELEDLARELEALEVEVGGQDEDAEAVLARWRQYRKAEGYDESEEEEDDPHKYDGRPADPILEKSVDQLLEEDRKRWEEQERMWQEQERQRQESWRQQQLIWQQQEEALARGTYNWADYGSFGVGTGGAGQGYYAGAPVGGAAGAVVTSPGYVAYGAGGNWGYQNDFYADYYQFTNDLDMSEFDTEEYIRLYQEALAMLEAQQKQLEEEEERRKKLDAAKKEADKQAKAAGGEQQQGDKKETTKDKKEAKAKKDGAKKDGAKKDGAKKGGAKKDGNESSDLEDSDADLDDEAVLAQAMENKRKKQEELKKLADQRAKVLLLGRAGKLPKKELTGKRETEASSGLKVDAKTGKLKVKQAGETIKINLKDAVDIKEIDGGCVVVMPKGFELTIKSKSRLAPRLKEVRANLLALDEKKK